jgi:hypothetical protein
MSLKNDPISLRLPPAIQAGVEAFATANQLGLAEAIETLLRERLLQESWLTEKQRRQVIAEANLKATVEAMLTRIKEEDTWGPDVTRTVFAEIQRDHGALHAEATADAELPRIHRDLGKLAKKILDAEVVKENGKTKLVNLPRNSGELIQAHSQLIRRGVGGASATSA